MEPNRGALLAHPWMRSSLTRASVSPAGLAVLTFGPMVSILAVPQLPALAAVDARSAAVVMLLAWMPCTPIGIPALMLQDERDRCTARRGMRRAWDVAVHLAVAGPARVVIASWLNVAGVVAAAAAFTR
jgi:hypothetical protein